MDIGTIDVQSTGYAKAFELSVIYTAAPSERGGGLFASSPRDAGEDEDAREWSLLSAYRTEHTVSSA